MLVDSHCHVHYPPLRERMDAVIRAMGAAGVDQALTVCTQLDEVPLLRNLMDAHPGLLYASVGVHPSTDANASCELDSLLELADSHPGFCAIGECGLDFHHHGPEARSWQQPRFATQIEAALAAGLPLIVHTRETIDDCLALLEPACARGLRAVLHCFTGSWEQAQRALDMGLMLSFTGIITFKKATAVLEVAARAPLERLMIETDAPYLAPEPHRGQDNEPGLLKHIAAKLAEARGLSYEELGRATAANARSFFALEDRS